RGSHGKPLRRRSQKESADRLSRARSSNACLAISGSCLLTPHLLIHDSSTQSVEICSIRAGKALRRAPAGGSADGHRAVEWRSAQIDRGAPCLILTHDQIHVVTRLKVSDGDRGDVRPTNGLDLLHV